MSVGQGEGHSEDPPQRQLHSLDLADLDWLEIITGPSILGSEMPELTLIWSAE